MVVLALVGISKAAGVNRSDIEASTKKMMSQMIGWSPSRDSYVISGVELADLDYEKSNSEIYSYVITIKLVVIFKDTKGEIPPTISHETYNIGYDKDKKIWVALHVAVESEMHRRVDKAFNH